MNPSQNVLNSLLVVLFLSSVIPFIGVPTSALSTSDTRGASLVLSDGDAIPAESAVREMSASSQPSSLHKILPLSILVYTEFLYKISVPGYDEWNNTMAAINDTYGTDYSYSNLTDYTQLATELPNHDVLLIPEQESGNNTIMKTIGTAWAIPMTEFVENGGIIILMTFSNVSAEIGVTSHIYNESGLLQIKGFSEIPISDPISLVNASDALARGIDSSFGAPNGCLGFDTAENTTVVDNGTLPIVIHKIIGRGHLVLLGFDLFQNDTNNNVGKILGNAIRLSRHVVFDESHTQQIKILFGFSSFADDLVAEGFAVSIMDEFNPTFFNASDVLVICYSNTIYSAGEAAAIQAFVENGGGLFVISEFGQWGDELDPVINEFGFYRNETHILQDTDDNSGGNFDFGVYTDRNLINHSLTLGVSRIEQYAGSGFRVMPTDAQSIIIADDDGTAQWEDGRSADSVTGYAALASEQGRIVVALEGGFLDDSNNADPGQDGQVNYQDSHHAILAVNTIRWLSAAGIKERTVLFDESHDPLQLVNVIGNYLPLARYLTSNGYTIQWMDPFNSSLLEKVDVLAISDGTSDHFPQEIAAIEAFVAAGGGLFLIGDHDATGEQVDPIGNEFGIDLNETGFLQDSDDNTALSGYIIYNINNFAPHPITEGVSRIELYYGTAFTTIGTATALVTTDTDGTCTWDSGGIASGLAVIAATAYQLGRVVYVTDSNFLQRSDFDADGIGNFYERDNNRFTMNAFQWLAERPPIISEIAPNGGETLASIYEVNWTVADPNGDPVTSDLSYSPNGSTWLPLDSGLTTSSYSWDTSGLADGDLYLVRVNVTDGFFTSQDESDATFTVDNHGPNITNVAYNSSTAKITAEVSDLSGVASVVLNFSIDAGGTWTASSMIKNSGDTYYFPTTMFCNGTIQYTVTATDNSAYHHMNTTSISSFTVEETSPPTSSNGLTGPSTDTEELEQNLQWAVYGGGATIGLLLLLFLLKKLLFRGKG